MNTIYIPTESDFRKWIREAIKECLEESGSTNALTTLEGTLDEPLLNRKEVAGLFRISLVTLHDWMNRGLPCIKQGGRVYFIRSETGWVNMVQRILISIHTCSIRIFRLLNCSLVLFASVFEKGHLIRGSALTDPCGFGVRPLSL